MEERVENYFERVPQATAVWSCGDKLWTTEGAALSSGLGEVKKHIRKAKKESKGSKAPEE